jgi:Fe-S cluster assembly ATPase SufC
MNIVLQSFDSDLRVELEGFKMLANGQIREKIATHVWRADGERGVLEKFSAGEKSRIEVAAIIALQSLINQSAASGGLNFVMIDEIIESVDAYGIEIILNSLNKLDRTILLVTHVGTGVIQYEHILQAIKENGETRLLVA